ncbi:hypothetical protein T492DRAFT_846229 [Pavlovales sp. CCMP2436]|nr:hypothetical protein T492DRAFT_846229 [Pavlovales sp. CCMP2436]
MRAVIRAAQRAARLGPSEPVRLELAAARAWARSGAFAAEALAADMADVARAGGAPLVVKRSASNLFMLVEGAEELSEGVDPAHRFELAEVGVGAFWAQLRAAGRQPEAGQAGSVREGLYVTGDAATLCPRAAASLAPAGSAESASEAFGIDGPARPPSLWLSSLGSVTVTHYDCSANILVQLLGEKRVWLWPPGAAAALFVFPDSHPRARKSRVDVASQARQQASPRSPGSSDAMFAAQGYSVLLRPGDALFIPPFYFHRVQVTHAPEGY